MSKSLAAQTAKGAAKIFAVSNLSNLAAVASGIIIPRFLGKEAYGEYAFLTASFLLAAISSSLGMRLIIARQFAPLYDRGEFDKAAGLYKAYFIANITCGFFVSMICFFFLRLACPFNFSSAVFILLSLLIPTWSLSESFFTLQLGVRNFGYWGLVFLLRSLSRLFLVVPGFFIGGMTGVVGGLILGESLIAFTGYILSSGLLSTKKINPDFALLWSHAKLAILAFAIQFSDNLRRYLGIIIVAFVTFDSDLTGYFELSLRIAVLVSSSLLLTAGSLMPTLSILHEQNDQSRLLHWVELSLRGGLFFLILIWGVFILVGRPVIVLLVGESFAPVYLLVSALLLSLPFRWIEAMHDQICNVNRKPELNFPSRIVWLLSFIVTGIWGLERWALLGLAIAYLFSFIISCGVSILLVWMTFRVRIVMRRSLTMFLCLSPFIVAFFLSKGFFERIIAANLSFILAILIAHLTCSLGAREIRALYRVIKGNMMP